MHKHTIDWYRQIHLTPDAPLAEKRWKAAEAITKNLPRARIIELLRLFLFPPFGADFTKQFTDELVTLDLEFPVTNNVQELRLMAGLIMVTCFEKPSKEATAFALGMRAANFPAKRVQPVEPAMFALGEGYLGEEANRQRPSDFDVESADITENLAKRVKQLAEESALLWWVLAEHSDALHQPVNKLDPEAYALAAAAEAAQRTMNLPPPPSIAPLLTRALQPCKASTKILKLSDYIKSTGPPWSSTHIMSVSVVDCGDLAPLCAVLNKIDELGSAATALKTVAKVCRGLKGELVLTPAQVAQQFYNELLFLRALNTMAN